MEINGTSGVFFEAGLRRPDGASNEAPAQAEKKLTSCPELVDHYTHKRDWTDP